MQCFFDFFFAGWFLLSIPAYSKSFIRIFKIFISFFCSWRVSSTCFISSSMWAWRPSSSLFSAWAWASSCSFLSSSSLSLASSGFSYVSLGPSSLSLAIWTSASIGSTYLSSFSSLTCSSSTCSFSQWDSTTVGLSFATLESSTSCDTIDSLMPFLFSPNLFWRHSQAY